MTTLLDPFAIGAPKPAIEAPAAPVANPESPRTEAPARQAAEGFSSQIRNAASDLRPRAAQTSRSPLAPSAKR